MGLFGWTLQFGIREFQRGGTGVICRIGVGEWVLVTHNTSCDTFAVNCFIKPLLRTQWNSVYGSFEVTLHTNISYFVGKFKSLLLLTLFFFVLQTDTNLRLFTGNVLRNWISVS